MCSLLQAMLLNQVPQHIDMKCRVYSLLARCYRIIGSDQFVKHIVSKGMELVEHTLASEQPG